MKRIFLQFELMRRNYTIMRKAAFYLFVVLGGCYFTGYAQVIESSKTRQIIGVTDNLPVLPPLSPMPAAPKPLPAGSVPMGDTAGVMEVKMDFPMAEGPFKPTWNSISQNSKSCPEWLREAKFGIWVHFGPQASGMSGDWYARKMYIEGSLAYNNHLKKYGHPTDSGYKEVLRDWNPEKLNPAWYVKLYHDIGARFMLIQAVHHDNFDLWNSAYQPWNSVNMGPKKDLLGEWASAVKKAGMHYGVAFHHEYTWWWWQTAFGSDKQGPKAGIPYDGALSLADGKGKWWEGFDPKLLYGINLREYKGMDEFEYNLPKGIFDRHLDYAHWYVNRWALRMLDVISKYDPDFIYTDGNSSQPFSGWNSGTGYKSDADQRVIASYYNHALAKHGKLDVFSITKFRPAGENGIVTTFEGNYPLNIKTDQAWIGENAVGDWFYAPDFTYDSGSIIHFLLECVSRDGAYAVNIPIKPDGSLEPACLKMLHEVGDWMKINGPAIYGSKAWVIPGEGREGKMRNLPTGALGKNQANFTFGIEDLRFTQGKDGSLYVFCMTVPKKGTQIIITSLGKSSKYSKQSVSSIKLLGYKGNIKWTQGANGIHIILPDMVSFKTALCFKVYRQPGPRQHGH